MNELLAFFLALGISFWGSLQLGPVNVCVIETALSQGKKQALLVATGGVLPEILYSSLAVLGAEIITQHPFLLETMNLAVIILLIAFGFYYFFKPYREIKVAPKSGAGFMKGFLLALFNPQLLPFWTGILIYFQGFINLNKGSFVSPYLGFVLGTAIGAWLLLFMFTQLALRYKPMLQKFMGQNMNRIVGLLFMVLALIEISRRIF